MCLNIIHDLQSSNILKIGLKQQGKERADPNKMKSLLRERVTIKPLENERL